MIGISIASKKALKAFVGKNIQHLIIETSMFGREYTGDDSKLCFVCPCPYTNRKSFGQITTVDGILTKVS